MTRTISSKPLEGRIACVAGATRGAGRAIAVELSRSGAFVYATGRSSRVTGPSDLGRPETIEETEVLMKEAGGEGTSHRVDHLEPQQVGALVERIEAEQGRLDILVNDIFGGDRYAEWDKPLWEHDLEGGLRMLRMGVDTHLITIAKAMPLLLKGGSGIVIEVTDGTAEFNANFRRNVGFYYDLVKGCVDRIVKGLKVELGDLPVVALGVTPGWLRSERMLEDFGVNEETWREACRERPGFAISESPAYVGRGVAALAADPEASRFAGRILTSRQLADTYGVTDIDGSQPDCWGFIDKYGIEYEGADGIDDFR
ncbi:MAG: SDR family oxidoreductase [Acidimicrobiales bacterium]|jgi:NAD(P)-dependent dehydrogenase (short-subunit alcohol dehydrogenase family)